MINDHASGQSSHALVSCREIPHLDLVTGGTLIHAYCGRAASSFALALPCC